MALEQRTRPYEILIRFWPDGRIGGQYQTITEILNDGVVIVAQGGDVVSLSTADFQGAGPTLESVMGEVNTAVMIENEGLHTQIQTLADQALSFDSKIQAVNNATAAVQAEYIDTSMQLANVQSQLDKAQSDYADALGTLEIVRRQLTDQAASFNGQIKDLNQQIESLNVQIDALKYQAQSQEPEQAETANPS